MRIAGLGALALALGACQTIQTSPTDLSAAQIDAVKSAVAKYLKDPESARFGKIAAGKASNGLVKVCGYVNGKNSFGAYGFESAFDLMITPAGAISNVSVESISPGASMGQATINNCRADGIAI